MTEENKETKEETKEEIIEDIEESGVPKEIAEKEEELDEKEQFSDDDYAETPEEILDEEELKDLEEMKRETEERVNGTKPEKIEETDVISAWDPKTKLGQEVKDEKIKNIDEILDSGRKILEQEIIESLIDIKSELVSIGQSKGKFGGGKRRAWRQTQRKTKEGNVPSFSTLAVVGDENGHIGIGIGKAKETLPARDKAIRKAKLNLIKVKRACSGFDCACSELHSIPFKVSGKAGSVRVTLIPAPQGTGLVVGRELKKVLALAGIKDIYSRTSGRKRTTFNLIKACVDALKKTSPKKKK